MTQVPTRNGLPYVGLSNLGATCYINCVIQSLYMIPEVRSAVYKWRTNSTVQPDTCILLQIQKLFARLQLTNRAYVDTKDLVKSFGWGGSETIVSQDVVEFMSVLFDAIQRYNSPSSSESLIEYLYQGTLDNYIECGTCHSISSRQEPFLSLSLYIKPTLEDSFSHFFTPEILEGFNKYYCDHCKTKSDATKGIKIGELPFLLCIQIKRFSFDYETFQSVKLNDKMTFPLSLNMGEGYTLSSVIVSVGSAKSGCLFVCCRDNDRWYKFDDTSVTEIEEKELENYYGVDDAKHNPPVAYVLVYRRASGNPIKSVSVDEIPAEIVELVNKENEK